MFCAKFATMRLTLRSSPRDPKIAGDVRGPFPDIRRTRRRRGADRAAGRFPRGTGAPETDRIRDSPRGSATKRICRAVRGAAGVADRLYRLGPEGGRGVHTSRAV